MIVTGKGVSETVANAARSSLDPEVRQLRVGGKLGGGGESSERLSWTKETHDIAKEFEEKIDFSLLKDFGVAAKANAEMKWIGPIVYSDVSPEPLKYDRSGQGNGYFGILALGPVHLPEYGDSGNKEIKSGEVAYFRESDPVMYRSCGRSRGMESTGLHLQVYHQTHLHQTKLFAFLLPIAYFPKIG